MSEQGLVESATRPRYSAPSDVFLMAFGISKWLDSFGRLVTTLLRFAKVRLIDALAQTIQGY